MALVVKNPPANAGDRRDMGSISDSGRSPGGGHGNPLRYSCLENPIDREARWATLLRADPGHTLANEREGQSLKAMGLVWRPSEHHK